MKYFILLTAFFSLNAACNSQVQTNSKTTSTMNTAPASENTTPVLPENLELATLGGGCFWCVEAIYQDLKGVTKVESGYSGGEIDNPSYREVCSGLSGHADSFARVRLTAPAPAGEVAQVRILGVDGDALIGEGAA